MDHFSRLWPHCRNSGDICSHHQLACAQSVGVFRIRLLCSSVHSLRGGGLPCVHSLPQGRPSANVYWKSEWVNDNNLGKNGDLRLQDQARYGAA
jgi:hypothetical protein